ncbi:hypothetical protein BDW69DRAFT_19420 [Aspergillus filifer]
MALFSPSAFSFSPPSPSPVSHTLSPYSLSQSFLSVTVSRPHSLCLFRSPIYYLIFLLPFLLNPFLNFSFSIFCFAVPLSYSSSHSFPVLVSSCRRTSCLLFSPS